VISNRSVPQASVIPELAYRDVAEASAWLCNAFVFTERLRIETHRVQLVFGDGAMVVTELGDTATSEADRATHSMLVRVEDADAHCDQAARAGAKVLDEPTDYPYGERQYNAEDLGGHRWTFSQSIADIDPNDPGRDAGQPRLGHVQPLIACETSDLLDRPIYRLHDARSRNNHSHRPVRQHSYALPFAVL
jgi:uncharacterized glyoxalase superfamily protein PhnB